MTRWRRSGLARSGLAAVVATALVTACSSSTEDTGGASSLTIAWIPKESGNPVFDLGKEGAFKAADELTKAGGKVDVVYMGPTGSNASEKIASQIAMVRDAIAKKVSGISISCNDSIQLQPVIDEAVAAGIPVMTWDSDSPGSKRFTYYGMDNKAGGAAAARLIARLIGEQGEVAILSGTRGAANLDQRVDGFSEEVATNHAQVQVVAKEYCDDDPPTCAKKVEAVMAAKPNVKAWFFAGLWALTTRSATKPNETDMPLWEAATQGGKLKTVVFDTLPFELDLMKANKVHGLIGQKYYGWGYDSVKIVVDKIKTKKEYPSFTDSKFDIVCPNAADAVAAMWAAKDFSQPVAECDLLK